MSGGQGRVRITLCAVTLAVTVLVAFGWAFDLQLAKTVLPGLTTMKANTALALATAAIGLLLASRPAASVAAGIVTAAIGLATLIEYAFGLRLGLDEVLVADTASTSLAFPGRMSPASAVAFVAIGAAIPLLAAGHSRAQLNTAHALALVPGSIGYLSLVGYIYGVEHLYNFGPYVSVALNTAVCLGMVSAAILLTHASRGWTYRFAGARSPPRSSGA